MNKAHKKEIPETMGAICAVVYLLVLIIFIPFPFYKDIVAATSGGGNRDIVFAQLEDVHKGRFLHKFPHNKVPIPSPHSFELKLTTLAASLLPLRHPLPPIRRHPRPRRRPLRHPLAPQILHPRLRLHTHSDRLLCRFRRHLCCHPHVPPSLPRRALQPRMAVLHLHGRYRHFLSK